MTLNNFFRSTSVWRQKSSFTNHRSLPELKTPKFSTQPQRLLSILSRCKKYRAKLKCFKNRNPKLLVLQIGPLVNNQLACSFKWYFQCKCVLWLFKAFRLFNKFGVANPNAYKPALLCGYFLYRIGSRNRTLEFRIYHATLVDWDKSWTVLVRLSSPVAIFSVFSDNHKPYKCEKIIHVAPVPGFESTNSYQYH